MDENSIFSGPSSAPKDQLKTGIANPAISQQVLVDVIMQLPACVCILKGPEFIYELTNEPYNLLFKKANLIGKKFMDALPNAQAEGLLGIFQKVYDSGEVFTAKEWPVYFYKGNNKKENEPLFLNLHCQPLKEDSGHNKRLLVFAYDTTNQVNDRKKIIGNEGKFANLFYENPLPMYTCDKVGNVDLYNDAALKLWGQKPKRSKEPWGDEEFLSLNSEKMLEGQWPTAVTQHNGIKEGVVIKTIGGIRRDMLAHPQLIKDKKGKITGTANTLIDITNQVSEIKSLENTGRIIENLYLKAPAFICTLHGPEHIFELVNPAYQKLYGKRKLVGKRILDAIPELKAQGIVEKLDIVFETGEAYVVTERLLYIAHDENKEPEPTYLNFSYQPMVDGNGNISGILIFGYEVTELVIARQKGQDNLKKILESLPQITSTSSAEGTNIFFNTFFFNYSGLSEEEAKINGWNSILHPDEIEQVLSDWDECKISGNDFYKEIRLKRESDGMYRWHIAHLTAIKNKQNQVTQWVASATDIHEQKSKEERKDEFLSIASHELKTPLTAIKAYLQLLGMSINNADQEVQLYVKKSIVSVNRLQGLISELLDVSKIQHEKFEMGITDFHFDEMIESCIESAQYNSPAHTIIKSGTKISFVSADKERLMQVISNLLSNAIKYSPDAKEVRICTAIENENIKVEIKDFGIGIAKQNLAKIFERYFRVQDYDIHFQGLGIGLYISMEIINKHHGRLWAESEPGKGSNFYFTIPLNQD